MTNELLECFEDSRICHTYITLCQITHISKIMRPVSKTITFIVIFLFNILRNKYLLFKKIRKQIAMAKNVQMIMHEIQQKYNQQRKKRSK